MRQAHYQLAAADVVKAQASNVDAGLTSAEAARRLLSDGPNEIDKAHNKSLIKMFWNQLHDFMILVLLAAATISGLIGDLKDTIVILVIVFLNAIVGVVQEYRAERAVKALGKMANPQAKVIRDGTAIQVSTDELVAGDIVLIESGNLIAADLRLIEAVDLQLDEAALTGESLAIVKQTEPLTDKNLMLGDQENMAWKGTLVNKGRGKGVVTATGMRSELGRIASLLDKEALGKTPLQQRLTRFGRYLALAVLVICVIVFFAGIWQGQPLLLMLLTAISLAVAAIPEALPAVITISLAMGAYKMSKKNSLIRRLPAVETLGSVTYICSDKTGTLTRNQMRLEFFYADGNKLEKLPTAKDAGFLYQRFGQALALNNDVSVAQEKLLGDPTEIALFHGAQSSGFMRSRLEKKMPRLDEVPFSSERKLMSTIHKNPQSNTGDRLLYAKGAPEALLELCRYELTGNGVADINSEVLINQAEKLAIEGFRVLAFAYKELGGTPDADQDKLESDLTFLGFAALIDPPRPEAKAAVAECVAAGITPVMITGDHPGTALAIAERVGIADKDSDVITGTELADLGDSEFKQKISQVKVYARVSPQQKIQIVKTLQTQGQFVAMTGDGVNDAPALKSADIGVAMGQKGTDVAREAADMVLLDDNFATIVTAVREGRRIFDNIRKFIKYTMTSNSGEIWTLFLAPFLGLPIPLLPIHILWINLVTDGLPGLALANEPAERNLMQRAPRSPKESIFAHGMWQHMLWVGLLIGALSLSGQYWAISTGSNNWQTIVFTVLTLSQLFHALAIRSESRSLFSLGLLSNRPLLLIVGFSMLIQLAVIYLPLLNGIFNTAPLSAMELLFCVLLSSVVLLAVEIEKALVRAGKIYQS